MKVVRDIWEAGSTATRIEAAKRKEPVASISLIKNDLKPRSPRPRFGPTNLRRASGRWGQRRPPLTPLKTLFLSSTIST